jgi:ABC-type polysaccharide/polyol phosphate export permease
MAISTLESNSKLSPLYRYWELVSTLAGREIKVRYRGSLLGVYWSLFNPLIMTVLYGAIFGAAFKKYYHDSIGEYTLAAFTGLAVIHFYNGCTSQSLPSIGFDRHLEYISIIDWNAANSSNSYID